MSRLHQTFDASQIDPSAALAVIPAGRYVGQIVDSEMRPTRNGLGQYLYLEMQILQGPCTGRKLFDRLNLVNSNRGTVEIAHRVLAAICHATGKLQLSDSVELHGIPMLLDVKVRPAKDGWGESNSIQYHPCKPVAQPAAGLAQPKSAPAGAPTEAPTPMVPTAPTVHTAPTMPTAPTAPVTSGLPWKRSS